MSSISSSRSIIHDACYKPFSKILTLKHAVKGLQKSSITKDLHIRTDRVALKEIHRVEAITVARSLKKVNIALNKFAQRKTVEGAVEQLNDIECDIFLQIVEKIGHGTSRDIKKFKLDFDQFVCEYQCKLAGESVGIVSVPNPAYDPDSSTSISLPTTSLDPEVDEIQEILNNPAVNATVEAFLASLPAKLDASDALVSYFDVINRDSSLIGVPQDLVRSIGLFFRVMDYNGSDGLEDIELAGSELENIKTIFKIGVLQIARQIKNFERSPLLNTEELKLLNDTLDNIHYNENEQTQLTDFLLNLAAGKIIHETSSASNISLKILANLLKPINQGMSNKVLANLIAGSLFFSKMNSNPQMKLVDLRNLRKMHYQFDNRGGLTITIRMAIGNKGDLKQKPVVLGTSTLTLSPADGYQSFREKTTIAVLTAPDCSPKTLEARDLVVCLAKKIGYSDISIGILGALSD